MDQAISDKRRAGAIFFFSLLLATGITVLAVLSLKEKMYVLMLICAFASAIGYYVAAFSFFRHSDAKAAIEILEAMTSSGQRCTTVSDVARYMGWTERATEKIIEKCIKKGYMRR